MTSRLSLLASSLATTVWLAGTGLATWERQRRLDVAESAPAPAGPLVSVVIPARDEERDIASTVTSLLAQQDANIELVVVDDRSSDETAARAEAAIAGDPRARVLAGNEPPSGWLGKPWACWQGAQATRGEWLLFSDADMRHEPTAIARALGVAERGDLPGVSLMPRLRTGSLGERVVLPAAFTAISTFIAPGPLVRSPRSSVAISVGGWTLLRRSVYERIGGHEAVADRVAEDIELARDAKAAGTPIEIADGVALTSLRMYDGLGGLWRGWSKNAAFGVRGGAAAALAAALALGALALAPPIFVLVGVVARRRELALVGAAGWLAQMALHLLARHPVETRRALAPAFPLGMAFLATVATRGSVRRAVGRGTMWRGREYRAAR